MYQRPGINVFCAAQSRCDPLLWQQHCLRHWALTQIHHDHIFPQAAPKSMFWFWLFQFCLLQSFQILRTRPWLQDTL